MCAAVEYERRDRNAKNRAARERSEYTDCARPAFGACRCPECATRSYERSAHFRGIPAWDPQSIVVELATGAEHGPYESEAEAAASLVFAKLSRDQVEIVSDAPITATATGWS